MEKLNLKIHQSLLYKLFITILFVIIFWLPGSRDLDVFMATDEGAWMYRAGDFYYALGQREFEHTFTTSHPGVVTSWIGTIGLLLEFPEYRGLGQGYLGEYLHYEGFLVANGVNPLHVLETSRFVMILFITIMLGVCFFVSLELFGFIFTSVSFLLVAFDPLFLATSRTYHLDAPLAGLILVSLLFLLLYYKNGAKSVLLLILSGLVAGGSVLAKLTGAVYALSAVGFIAVYPFLFEALEAKTYKQTIKAVMSKVVIWGSSAGLAMFIFWPAMWVKPLEVIGNLISFALGASSGGEGASSAFVEPTTLFFYNPLQPSFMNYPAILLWRTTPVVLFGLGLAVVAFIMKISAWQNKKFRGSIFGLLLFSVIYTVVMSISVKQSQKYFVPVILVFDLIAGFGLASLPEVVAKFGKSARRSIQLAAGAVIAALLALQILLVLPTHPYYFTYYNPLLGGPQAASEKIFVGTGEGLNLAGEYLNQKPGAEELNVLSWYGVGCLSFFFDGHVEIIDLDDTWSEGEQVLLQNSDYLVTYSNQWFRNRPEELLVQLETVTPEYTIWLNGIEYARIYDTDQLPDALFGR